MTESLLMVSLAPSRKRVFPGESVQIDIELVAAADLANVQVALRVPAGCELQLADEVFGAGRPHIVAFANDEQMVIWEGVQLQVQTPATLHVSLAVQRNGWAWRAAEHHRLLHFQCEATSPALPSPATGGVTIAVLRHADLVKFLPGIYQDDRDEVAIDSDAMHGTAGDFMRRFLMLIERMVEPTQDRITHLAWYFDYTVAPAHMLPWLAWCLSFDFYPVWDEARQRRALGMMARLYRQRGTKAGLKALLELYFDERPKIMEPGCLLLKNETRLGYSTVLGDRRRPHHFSVEFRRTLFAQEEALARALIAANKPAHTEFDLITAVSSTERK